MITIQVNNIAKEIEEQTSVTSLLGTLQQPENGIAVAINDTVITKPNWQTTQLQVNDNVLIIKATQGG